MNQQPWPQQRAAAFVPSGTAQGLTGAWQFSRERIAVIRSLCLRGGLPPEILTVAVSGSLCRMEAHEGSDLDLLIVIDDRQHAVSEQRASDISGEIWCRIAELGIRPPKSGGVFACCARWKQLTDRSARGIVDEPMTIFGQRMQLLLDAQPLVLGDAFDDLQRQILSWYSETRMATLFAEAGVFHWLWQDVQRYWRSLRSRACWLDADDPQKALEVNLKLRSSRLVIVIAFLLSIDEAHRHGDSPFEQQQHLSQCLRQTALERLAAAVPDPAERQTLLAAYDAVWCHIASSRRSQSVPQSIQGALADLLTSVRQCVAERCRIETAHAGTDWLF